MRLIHLDDREGVRPLPNVDSPDQAAASALGGVESRCQWAPGDLASFDTALVSMTKYQHRDREDSWMSAIPMAKRAGLRTWLFQEAEADWFNCRPDEEQLAFVRNVRQADGMLCHTEDAAAFYRALLGIPCVAVPTLMPLSRLPKRREQELIPRRLVILGTPDERARGWWALAAWKAAGIEHNWRLDVITRDGADNGARARPVLDALGLVGRTYGYLPLSQYADLFNGATLIVTMLRARAAQRDHILAYHYQVPIVDTWTINVDRFSAVVEAIRGHAQMVFNTREYRAGMQAHDWDPERSPLVYRVALTEGGLL